jgi:hypothetical protein
MRRGHPRAPIFYALDGLPPGYALVRTLAIQSPAMFWLLNLAALIPFALGYGGLALVDALLNALAPPSGVRPRPDEASLVLFTLAAVVVMLALHEGCHGLGFRAFGARPRYGVRWRSLVLFASAEGYYLSRDAYLVVALLPLVALTAATLLLMMLTSGEVRTVVMLAGAANIGGSVGDLWFVLVCRRFPPALLVHDVGEGAALFMPGGAGDEA